MQVILDSLFARPSSAPIGGGKKGEFRDWTKAMIGYPGGQDGAILLARDYLPCLARTFLPLTKNFFLLTKLVRSRWLDIGLLLFFASLWTSTPVRSINTPKKNLAKSQSS